MFLLSEDFWEAKTTKQKGFGIFAKKEIMAGTVIGDYLGKVIKTEEYDLEQDKKGLYLMYLTDEASIYPDLKSEGLHLINHSCRPNAWINFLQGHTLFFAIKNIKPGEEVLISYLLDPKDEFCDPCPHDCYCESRFCTGTMHLPKKSYEKWQKFQDAQKKGDTKLKFTFGKNLPRLTSYPKTLPIESIYKEIIYG